VEDLRGGPEDENLLPEMSRMAAVSEGLHGRLEKRFPDKKNHWKRVSYYAMQTARKMELDDDYVSLIEKAGGLMDIGMLRFGDAFRADAVELKPWEKEMIRRHPVYGVGILATVRIDWEVLPLVRHHHEWWNGAGYPDGLKGEAIPLGSRVLHLADAFVAMTSYRAYKGAREAREALAEIEDCGGAQFDPRVVQAFAAFMAPRVFPGSGGMPPETEGAKMRAMSLIGGNAGTERHASPDNGNGSMGVLEVEDLLRDISGQSA
jgi:HD-GYP domain-containing protein (c-di-GMP phosphodiesterase class II)